MNTYQFLNSHPITSGAIAEDMTSLRSKLFAAGVCWIDDVQGKFSTKPFRVVLHTRGGQLDYKNPMLRECNGLVLEYDNGWGVLSMPQPAFCTNKISMKKLNDLHLAGGYEVYEVLDATIVTLYHYKNKWCLSSTKGYDISNTSMVDGMTYMEAIQHLLDTKYCSFRFDDLNKGYSYTVALRHSKYHIFDETKHMANRTKNVPKAGVDMNSYIMIMCVADTAAMRYVSKHVPGLPQQNPLPQRDSSAHALTSYARSAYTKYAKAYRLNNFKYKPLYGYIMRAKHRMVPDEYSTIYIESELYRTIKLGLYKDNQFIRTADYNQLVIQMSMNHERYEQFTALFQQFGDKFKDLDNAINTIAASVIERLVSELLEPSGETPNLIDKLVAQFNNEPDITQGIVKDALYSKVYAEHLLSLLD
jgi:hypothetical protein